jgi:hypothetical protein
MAWAAVVVGQHRAYTFDCMPAGQLHCIGALRHPTGPKLAHWLFSGEFMWPWHLHRDIGRL